MASSKRLAMIVRKGLFLWFALAISIFMAACERNPVSEDPDVKARALKARADAKAMLLDPSRAFLGRGELVVREEALVESALDQTMRNVEFWLSRDPALLRNQLGVQTDMARGEMLVSEAGMAALRRQAAARFAAPEILKRTVANPGVKASAVERKLSEVAGVVLSGRPAVARDIPPETYFEVEADYGLLPAPLERNNPAKGSVTPVRYRAENDGWLENGRPAMAVVARSVGELAKRHPDATRVILVFTVLRRMGQPAEWRFVAETTGDGFVVRGAGRAPGFDEQIPPVKFSSAELIGLAAKAPGS